MNDNFLLSKRGRNHVLKKPKVRRGCTVSSSLTWPSTNKSDGIEKFATTGSVDGCSVLAETQFVWTRLRVDTTRVSFVGGFLSLRRLPEFDIKPPVGAPLLIFPRGYLLKFFPQGI